MVFFKRAPVAYSPDPNIRDENTQVWMIKQTGEVFTEYDKYANRLDFYRKKTFTNQITGQGNLSFFDALEAEDEDAREIRSIFPGPLRYQVCRKVHHSTIPRLEELVTRVHADLKDDYYPGEHVIAQIDENTDKRVPGVIRDKITFSPSVDARIHPMLNHPPLSRYFVTVTNDNGTSNDMLLDSKRLSRDRRTYSRSILRSFIRNIAHSDNYKGAPWQVKAELVAEFRLPKEVPYHLTAQGIAEAKKSLIKNEPTTFFNYYRGPGNELQRQPPQTVTAFQHTTVFQGPPPTTGVFRPGPGVPAPPPFQPTPGNQMPNVPVNGHFGGPQHQITIPARPPPQAPPRPAPVKYPIEDLLIQPKRNGLQRPSLKFLSDDVPPGAEPPAEQLGLQMKSIGDLLFIWQTLNVHAEVFILDSFTVDDFIEALGYHGEASNCELLTEMHCAVLKQLVDEAGNIKVLPELAGEFSQDIEPEEDSQPSTSKSPTPAREETPPARRTRASLSKLQALEPEPEPVKEVESGPTNRASELLSQFDWIDNLAHRNFQGGGWQAVLAGAIRQASLNPHRKEVCEQILAHLAPSDMDPEPATARSQYNSLDINLRIAALKIITMYSTFTDAVRTYMLNCNMNMTSIRNQKMEQQRKRKELQAEFNQLDQKRKMEYAATLSASPPAADTNGDVSMSNVTEPDTNADHSAATEDEEGSSRRLRRANSRKRKHEDEAARKEREKREKEEAEKKKQRDAYRETMKKLEKLQESIKGCEDEIKKFDEELRENQCQQLRCLGKDRFCNTYWWLERWGMPLGGLPTSSTAEYGYVNGRLWIQGPDELDQPLLEHPDSEDEREYKTLTGLTKPERRDLEEGTVHLTDSTQWGFFDSPEDVQKLLEWLDDRGHRELKLKKELGHWSDSITEYMVNWRTHLSEVQAQKTAGEDTSGIQTRKKTYSDNDSSKYWCLRWENTYAYDEMDHLHSQQPAPTKKGKNAKSKKSGR